VWSFLRSKAFSFFHLSLSGPSSTDTVRRRSIRPRV